MVKISLLDIYRSWLDSLPSPFDNSQNKFYEDTMADSIESLFIIGDISFYMVATEYGGIQVLLAKVDSVRPESSIILLDEAHSFKTEEELEKLFNLVLEKAAFNYLS